MTAVFHSHPGRVPFLSGADRNAQVSNGLPWWLACDGVIMKFRPVPLLLGRKFKHGVMDCYTLFRMHIIFAELTFLTSNALMGGGYVVKIFI